MERGDFEILLDLIDRKIQRSRPTVAEYWRGFRRGVSEYFQPKPEAAPCDPSLLREIARRNHADPYLEAYARGYCDGCQGLMSPVF